MNDVKTEERKLLQEQLESTRAMLRATGATVLSPTPEWVALRKKVLELNKQLK